MNITNPTFLILIMNRLNNDKNKGIMIVELNDLRIGNLLMNISDEPETLIVDVIDSIEETINANGLEGIKIEDVLPIPITEDNLVSLDLGFKKEGDDIYMRITDNLELVFTYDQGSGVRLDIDTEKLRIQTTIKVKYVHSLQNLVRDLTQKIDLSCLCEIKG